MHIISSPVLIPAVFYPLVSLSAKFCYALPYRSSSSGQVLDCNTGYGCFYTKPSVSLKTQNRKVLAGLEEKRESVKVGLQGSPTSVNGGSFVGYELRNVPSGPDPLHHNRASPEKPRTP
uniref:Uncharacterized protein n=1 Tax=Quercus lobata TaxID=97700 RepID=A0A7N2QX77_QUELO